MATEQTAGIDLNLQHIKRFFAVFKDSKKETCFRQEALPKQRRLVFKLCAFLALTMPVFMITDYMIVKPEPWSTFLLGQRLVQIGSCLIFLAIVPHVRSSLFYDALVFITLLVFFVLLELGSFTFADDYALYALFDIIIIISLYASRILTVQLSLILCACHSLVAISIVFWVKNLDVHSQIVMTLGYVLSNGAGVMLAISQQRNARQQFLLQNFLREKTLQLKQLAYRDSLTNALNRRAFQDHFRDIERMAVRMQTDHKNQFLIAADIDHFKAVNDNYGHDVGDKVLVAFTALVEANIRPLDNVYRFGGEEFMILLQDCDSDIAIKRIEQLMRLLNDTGLNIEELQHPVTCSFGITPILVTDTMDSVCIRADEALYLAKNNGRNQYRFHPGSDPKPSDYAL
jgi:diguanylate cyclase (GGDEF)-like protein